jgi:hypothetical protein
MCIQTFDIYDLLIKRSSAVYRLRCSGFVPIITRIFYNPISMNLHHCLPYQILSSLRISASLSGIVPAILQSFFPLAFVLLPLSVIFCSTHCFSFIYFDIAVAYDFVISVLPRTIEQNISFLFVCPFHFLNIEIMNSFKLERIVMYLTYLYELKMLSSRFAFCFNFSL